MGRLNYLKAAMWSVHFENEGKHVWQFTQCPLENNGEMLQGPGVTVRREDLDSSNEKTNKKVSKNLWHSTQQSCENGSSIKKQNGVSTLNKWSNVTETLRDSHTKIVKQFQ